MFEQHAPGVFLVRYRERNDLAPANQDRLVEAIRAASLAGPVGVVFDVGPAVSWIDVTVPTFWLQTIADRRVRIGAMAIVTGSLAVELAVGGFALASSLRRSELQVKTFPAQFAAQAWVRAAIAQAPRFATT
jgi:hypothetical protein